MRLIDADKLLKVFDKHFNKFAYAEYSLAYDLIDNQPAAFCWHYPSKGDRPDEYHRVLCLIRYETEPFCTFGMMMGDKRWAGDSGVVWNREPDAWMPLPESSKEEV